MLINRGVKKILLGPDEFMQYENEVAPLVGGNANYFYGGGAKTQVEKMQDIGIKFV